MLSSSLQPEFSAALVGLKPPQQAVAQARRRIEHFLEAIR